MKTLITQDYLRPEITLMAFENLICQDSTYTSNFEDGGSLSGEWK